MNYKRNQRACDNAEHAITGGAYIAAPIHDTDDIETGIVALLTDLLHYGDARGYRLTDLLERANSLYCAQKFPQRVVTVKYDAEMMSETFSTPGARKLAQPYDVIVTEDDTCIYRETWSQRSEAKQDAMRAAREYNATWDMEVHSNQ